MADFQKSSQDEQIAVLTTPLFVPTTENPSMESEAQSKEICETFFRLPRGTKYKLSLTDTSQKIQLIGQKYGFELLRLANITRLIRDYYFGEVRLEDFPKEIERRMGVSLLTAQEITRYLKSEILDWNPWSEYLAQLPRLTVREIVANHPKLADTEITAGYIELRNPASPTGNSDDQEDPTIKNWIRDYVSHLGYEKHSQMERTQYLFHSENGKNLSSPDREKLGIILRSFDENIPLPVDENNEEIVFESKTSPKGGSILDRSDQRPMTSRPAAANAQKLPPVSVPAKQEFIKPYRAIRPPMQKAAPPISRPAAPDRPAPNPEVDKYLSAPDSPSIRIQSITERNEPRVAPSAPPRPIPPFPLLRPALPPQTQAPFKPSAFSSEEKPHPKHRIIDPFSHRLPEPKLDGNIVDLSVNNKE